MLYESAVFPYPPTGFARTHMLCRADEDKVSPVQEVTVVTESAMQKLKTGLATRNTRTTMCEPPDFAAALSRTTPIRHYLTG